MVWQPDPHALRGKVAVVAGATRGAGRGIAAALGECGATVVCTGRTSRRGRGGSDYDRAAETIEGTAELVSSLGGEGLAAQVDHLDHDQVRALAERLRRDHGHIDLLVNDIWGAEELKEWDTPVWEHDLDNGLRILRLAIDTHLITAHFLLPLLIDRPGGVHVEVGDGTASYNAAHYRLCAYYDLAKVAANRLAFSMAHELGPLAATAVGVSPGWLRSELMLDAFEVTADTWREALTPREGKPQAPPSFELSETPRYVGRGIAALVADADRHDWHGRTVTAGDLAARYGCLDVDGRQPQVWRHMEDEEAGVATALADYT